LEADKGIMENKITLVTEPDDINIDGIRILAYDLTPEQSQIFSNCFLPIENFSPIVVYVANGQNDPKWTIDKKQKCSIIILNAESQDQTMVGYLTAQKNSYYFGNLRSISEANVSLIQDTTQLTTIMEEHITKYEKL
jgi:hypothetical protein